jgi:hypothetical protein
MAIYLGAVLAGLSCAYLILTHSIAAWGGAAVPGIRVWGFRGPLGAFLTAWGGGCMLASAPFDDWWHNAYGLDVKILSPPHVVLIVGALAVLVGALVTILAVQNRATGPIRKRLSKVFLYTAGMTLVCLMFLFLEFTWRNHMHSAPVYVLVMAAVPLLVVGTAEATDERWAATTVTGVYTALLLCMVWGLPRFPATPRLGPVYQRVDHFLPPEFPMLLLVPGLLLDLTRHWIQRLGRIPASLATSALFLLALVAVQWPFASFLMEPGGHGWLFPPRDFKFSSPPSVLERARHFYHLDATPTVFWFRMTLAFLLGTLSSYLGGVLARALRKVQR